MRLLTDPRRSGLGRERRRISRPPGPMLPHPRSAPAHLAIGKPSSNSRIVHSLSKAHGRYLFH